LVFYIKKQGFETQTHFFDVVMRLAWHFLWKVLLISGSKDNIIICHTSFLTTPLNSFLLFFIITFAFHSFLPFSPSSHSHFLPFMSPPLHRIHHSFLPSSPLSPPPFLLSFLCSPSWYQSFLPCYSPPVIASVFSTTSSPFHYIRLSFLLSCPRHRVYHSFLPSLLPFVKPT